jgi:hypothetical protein
VGVTNAEVSKRRSRGLERRAVADARRSVGSRRTAGTSRSRGVRESSATAHTKHVRVVVRDGRCGAGAMPVRLSRNETPPPITWHCERRIRTLPAGVTCFQFQTKCS